ncbi:fluoride efflux transporter CrcB [Elioraea sp.]|uniref:fluoride efflux transporter CrcB n=1 Tax=Elioraea sp. TaxID=2185103 RepID=UPI0025BBE144|nr:fluoride efflux transporter CrcB [Elioraea sp.]
MSALSPLALGAVAAGGAAGSVCRYLVSVGTISLGFAAPWATLAVNVAGSFVIGLMAELFARELVAPLWRPLLITGFLGGFTTFSAFSLEAIGLWREAPGTAALYVAASVVLSLKACLGGILLARVLA